MPGANPTSLGSGTAVRDIQPPGRWSSVRFGDLWQSRELLFFLSLRDIKVRYKQAFIGVGWAVIQPIFMMLVFWIFLGRLAKVGSEGLPYSVFAFSGLIPWLLFANGVTTASDSLVNSANLISKVYFPRLVIPLAAVASWVPDVFIGILVLIGVMAVYGIAPAGAVVLLPLFIALGFLTAVSFSLWLSALNVAYRDIHYAAPFFIQLGLFLTPVTYPSTLVHAHLLRLALSLNPMTGVVEGFRWALLGGAAPWSAVGISFLVTCIILLSGILYFRRVEQFFADII
ncbi:MAG TPA: ABC transporter permease [Actinomycetota bacterium]|nr:ABC transporter permease [Actinomycetota bacterium]